jgi:hypothetical protein
MSPLNRRAFPKCGAGAIITVLYIVGMIVIWLAPETKGRPLPA